jgi:RNA polymerase sigma-70 factor (ECF subfamily)
MYFRESGAAALDYTDEELVRLCLNGQPEIFRKLIIKYENMIIKFLSSRLEDGNEVVEAAQEVMVRAYFALPKLRKATAFSSWILGIADRVAKETRRDRRHAGQLDAEAILGRLEAPPERGCRMDQELDRAVAALPDLHRQVILLRFYEGRSCAEISRNLRVSLGTVTSRLSRAYSQLRDMLREHDQDAEVGA